MKSIFGKGILVLLFISFYTSQLCAWSDGSNYFNPVKGKVICIDPGHGGTAATDSYRVGPTGEREEWINLRVALLLGELLDEAGAEVVLTRTTDTFIPFPLNNCPTNFSATFFPNATLA